MKQKNFLRKMLCTVLGASLLVGCSQGGNTASNEVKKTSGTPVSTSSKKSSKEASETSKEVTLNFWHHYSAQSKENETLMKVIIPKFEEENPEIHVNAVSHEWADLHDKLLISAKSNTLPDVARLDSAWVPEFAQMGILVPLNKEISEYGDVAGKLLESAMSTAKIGKDQFGLALNTNTKIMFYNVEALGKAGIKAPATMEEFAKACETLSGKNDKGQQIWGYDEPGLSGWNLCPFIWSMGGELTNPEQTKASGYINNDDTVKAVQIFADLCKKGAITGWNSGDIPMTDGFGTGRYAMILDGPWKVAELSGAYPDFKYKTAPVPSGKGGSISVLGGEDISIFKNADKEAAWKFVKFMTGEFAQEEMAKCGQIPVNKTTLESDAVKKADFAPFIEQLKTAKTRPTTAVWGKIDEELKAAVTEIVSGEMDVKKGMDNLALKVDKLLSE